MDIVEEMRGFEIDHEPDGWPAVQMKQVSALCDEIDALRAELQKAPSACIGRTYLPKITDDHMGQFGDTELMELLTGGEPSWSQLAVDFCCAIPYSAPVPAMTMQSVVLTDDEIVKLADESRSAEPNKNGGYVLPISFARVIERAVIAKAMPIPKQEPAWEVHDGQINFDVELPVIRVLLKQSGHDKEAQIAQQTLEYICALRRELGALKIIINCENTSPRITEQDDDGLLPIDAGSHPDCRVMCWSESELRSIKDYARRCIAAAKTQRITEQDARQILEDYIGYCECKKLRPESSVVIKLWTKNESSVLLDKLNGASRENT